jgi:hypothetical protein
LRLQVAAGSGKGSFVATGGKRQTPAWLGAGLIALCLAVAVGGAAYFLMQKKTPPAGPAPVAAMQQQVPTPATVQYASAPVNGVASVTSSHATMESATTHAELLRLFRQQLADMLGLPSGVVAKGGVLRALDAQGVPPEVQEKVHQVWQQCEAAVYAPGGIGTDQPLHQTAQDAAAALDQIGFRPAA